MIRPPVAGNRTFGRRTPPKPPVPLEANDLALMAVLAGSQDPLGTAQLLGKLTTIKPHEILRRLKKLGAAGVLERGKNRAQWQLTAVGHVRYQVGK